MRNREILVSKEKGARVFHVGRRRDFFLLAESFGGDVKVDVKPLLKERVVVTTFEASNNNTAIVHQTVRDMMPK